MSIVRNAAKHRLAAAERSLGMSVRFILSGSDVAVMMAAARERTGSLRGKC